MNNFLPNLCNVQSVVGLVLVGELLSLAIVIADSGLRFFNWLSFGETSMLVLWVMLASAACICPLRPQFERYGGVAAGVTSYIIVVVNTGFFSSIGHWVHYRDLTLDWYTVTNNVIMASIVAGVFLRYFYLQQQLRDQQQAELNARFKALQSRIRPHFLFNSMNSIASLIDLDPARAEKMVVDLAALFRASLRQSSIVTLDEEVSLCRQFVSIEQVRLEDRLNVIWHVADMNGKQQIPSLLLQPLIENAIYHGIQPLDDGGDVEVSVVTDNDQVVIRIENPVLSPPQQTRKRFDDVEQSNGMALENIRHRLRAVYGPKASLIVERTNDRFTVVIHYRVLNNQDKEVT